VGGVLTFATIVMLVFVALVVAAVLSVRHTLKRHNAVSIRYGSDAPLSWLMSPMPPAVLHRRLRDAVALLRVSVPIEKGRRRRPSEDRSPYARLADDIELHAAGLDRDLQLLARLRGPDRAAVRTNLAGQVLELERLAQRVAAAATAYRPGRPTSEPTPAALTRMNEELDSLESARDEIARLEADLGLHAPVPLVPRAPRKPLPPPR
jgi:hypothetical protein